MRERGPGFPLGPLHDGTPTLGDIEDAVKTGPYGRCVFGGCDNDQPDVVHALLRMGDVVGTFEMRSLTEKICSRITNICGPLGEINGDMTTITLTEFRGDGKHKSRTFEPLALTREDTLVSGHWGADWYLLNAWCAAVAREDPSLLLTDAQTSLQSHLTVFKGIDDCVAHTTPTE